jgi:hypothetical protein
MEQTSTALSFPRGARVSKERPKRAREHATPLMVHMGIRAALRASSETSNLRAWRRGPARRSWIATPEILNAPCATLNMQFGSGVVPESSLQPHIEGPWATLVANITPVNANPKRSPATSKHVVAYFLKTFSGHFQTCWGIFSHVNPMSKLKRHMPQPRGCRKTHFN